MTSNMWAVALVSGGLVEHLRVSGGRAEITQRFLGGWLVSKGGRGDDEKMGGRKGCAVSR